MKPARARIRESVTDRHRAQTIARLISDIKSRTGTEPSNAELARLLARSESSIGRLRRLLDGGANA